MATNTAVSSKAGLIELLGQECCSDYFNEAVGGDSIMGAALAKFLLTSTSSRTHALWSPLWTSYTVLLEIWNCTKNSRELQQIPPHLFMKQHGLLCCERSTCS